MANASVDPRAELIRLGLRPAPRVPPRGTLEIRRGDGVEIKGETWTVMSVFPHTVVIASRRATKVIAREAIASRKPL
jgi:hypothetical protein